MNLRSRLNRLEKSLGSPDAPKTVVISPASDRHDIRWINRDILGLHVPWDPKYRGAADPIDDLTPEQLRMIGPGDKTLSLCFSPDEIGPDRDILNL